MLLCPLCGKMSSLRLYRPSHFEEDIFIQSVRGLGRGRGFRSVGVRSAFESKDDHRVGLMLEEVCERSLAIVQVLLDNDIIDIEAVADKLALSQTSNSQDLASKVLEFLQLDPVEEFLYDADPETQELALRLKRQALLES